MGNTTPRGDAVAAGYAALANATGDDTLVMPDTDQSTGTGDAVKVQSDADRTGEAERDQAPADAPAPGPADIPAPPVIETADDPDPAARQTRS